MRRSASTRWAGLGLAALLAGCASTGAPGAEDPAGPRLYAPNQDDATVSVIDVGTLEVVETVDLTTMGFGPNAKPHHVVVERDGSHWYLSLIGENTILKLDRSNRIVDRAEYEVPGMMALHPTEEVLYVGRSMSAVNPPRRIGRVDRGSMEVEELSVFFPRPHALAVGPEGEPVYTASLAENAMAAVWPEDEDLEVLDLPGADGATYSLVQFAVSPDGSTLVGTAELTGELLVFDLTDPASPDLVATLEVGSRPWHPVFTPDGSRIFFGLKGDDAVAVVDTRSWELMATVSGDFDRPHGAAVSPDGSVVFVSSNGSAGEPGSVVAIDAASLEVLRVIPLGRNVAGLGTPGS